LQLPGLDWRDALILTGRKRGATHKNDEDKQGGWLAASETDGNVHGSTSKTRVVYAWGR
jgi:hypothetical protein